MRGLHNDVLRLGSQLGFPCHRSFYYLFLSREFFLGCWFFLLR